MQASQTKDHLLDEIHAILLELVRRRLQLNTEKPFFGVVEKAWSISSEKPGRGAMQFQLSDRLCADLQVSNAVLHVECKFRRSDLKRCAPTRLAGLLKIAAGFEADITAPSKVLVSATL